MEENIIYNSTTCILILKRFNLVNSAHRTESNSPLWRKYTSSKGPLLTLALIFQPKRCDVLRH